MNEESRTEIAYGRAAGTVSAALGLAALLLYAFFAIASHTLSGDEYGEVVVLWVLVFATVSVLFRPIEQLLAREIAVAREAGGQGTQVLRSAALIGGLLLTAFLAAAVVLHDPLTDDLFSGDEFLFWALIAGVATFAADYAVRGILSGSARFDLYAILLVTECAVLAGIATLAAAGVTPGLHAFAAGIAGAPLLGLLAAAVAAARGSLRPGQVPGQAPAPAAIARHGGFAAALIAIMLCEQVLVNSGPLFVRGAEGVAAAGFVFNLLMVARAPAVLFQGVAASLLPTLAALGQAGHSREFDAILRRTLAGVAGFTVVVVVGALAIGPSVMELVFGDEFAYGRDDLVVVALGMGSLLAATTLTQAALVRGQATVAAAAWGAAALGFVAFNLTGAFDAAQRVEVGFAAATAALAIGLALIGRRPGSPLEPGSPDELHARIAARDEIGLT